jgi:hypothetical protein
MNIEYDWIEPTALDLDGGMGTWEFRFETSHAMCCGYEVVECSGDTSYVENENTLVVESNPYLAASSLFFPVPPFIPWTLQATSYLLELDTN